MKYKIIGKYIKNLNLIFQSLNLFTFKGGKNYKINIDIKSEQIKENIIEIQTSLN